MRRCLVVVLCLTYCVILCGAQSSQQQEGKVVVIPAGFYSAGDYLEFPPAAQAAYAAGFINGLFVSTVFNANKSAVIEIEDCLRGATDDEVAARITKYIQEHPESKDLDLNVESLNAITSACPKLKDKMK